MRRKIANKKEPSEEEEEKNEINQPKRFINSFIIFVE